MHRKIHIDDRIMVIRFWKRVTVHFAPLSILADIIIKDVGMEDAPVHIHHPKHAKALNDRHFNRLNRLDRILPSTPTTHFNFFLLKPTCYCSYFEQEFQTELFIGCDKNANFAWLSKGLIEIVDSNGSLSFTEFVSAEFMTTLGYISTPLPSEYELNISLDQSRLIDATTTRRWQDEESFHWLNIHGVILFFMVRLVLKESYNDKLLNDKSVYLNKSFIHDSKTT